MKRIILIGKTGCGKTTLAQRLTGDAIQYRKTQTVSVQGGRILDTPGEYLEQRNLYNALIVTSADADVIAFLIDVTDRECGFSPGMAGMFSKPVIGVVTKCDLCTDSSNRIAASRLLTLAGVKKIFFLGLGCEGDDLNRLIEYLQ